MLKWIAQKGDNPRSASPSRSNKTPDSIHDTSPWLTDDPLATINVNTILDTKRKSGASKRQTKPDQVYSVTRTNPLFVDTPKEMLPTNLSEGEKRLMDDSRSSNRSEQCQTPSSSGYESADPMKRLGNNTTSNHKNQPVVVQHQRHQRHHQQHLVELSPASDYRRQFVLGPRLDRSSPPRKMTPDVATAAAPDAPIRIGKANLLHQNSHYVTRIHMHPPPAKDMTSSNADEASKQRAVDDEWEKYEQSHTGDFVNVSSKIPHPVWPANPTVQRNNASAVATSAIVQQNENYVTKILIAPAWTVEKKKDQTGQQPEAFDSIVTHSLLVMTSYDDGQSIDDSTPEQIVAPKSADAELSEIRQLSQTISQSRVVATVSRALSKSGSASSETSYPTTPSSKHTEIASSSSSSSSPSSSVGGSIARRISMMKERWDKSSRRRLLTESDDDDPAFLSRRLDHVYVPQNGDVNFSVQPRNNSNGDLPFSYLAGVYHPATITEEVTANESQVHAVIVPSDRMPLSHYDPFEQDRESNSSSRSSGSRRVTFSADTVDNEQSTKSTNSTASGSSAGSITGSITGSTASDKTTSNHCPNIMEELKLNPHYLPHRYQPPGSASDVLCSGGRLAGYYSYNLQAQLDNYNAKGQPEKVSTWEHYHGQDVSPPSKPPAGPYSPVRPSSSGTVRLDPYNNLQFHPNYGAACQERSICVDFTLDGVEEALLQRRSDSHKLRRRICCCLLLLLCLVVLVIVVIVISLYLSQGQRIFGSV